MSIAQICTRSGMVIMLLVAFFVATAAGAGSASDASHQYDATLTKMLASIQSRSHDQFVEPGDERFKKGFSEKMFAELYQLLGQRMKQGYDATFLTTLRQQDYVVYIWKLAFKDEKDDYIIRMAVKDGIVRGFVIR